MGAVLCLLLTANLVYAEALMERPRLLFAGSTLAQLREKAKEPVSAEIYAALLKQCDGLLKTPVVSPPPAPSTAMDRSPGELGKARRGQHNIVSLSLAYLLTGNRAYLDRDWAEIECWCDQWKSWTDPYHGPAEFFDLMTGEMGLTMGLAYDWLKNDLEPGKRAKLKDHLSRRVVNLYLANTDPPKPAWWYTKYHNWNTVCNGGAVIAALALDGEHPRSGEVIARVKASWDGFFDALGTEGGWDEGTGYWQYGIRYAIPAAFALNERGIGDGGQLDKPGTRMTGYFPMYFCPGGVPVSWGDSGGAVRDPVLYLLGRIYRNPDFVRHLDTLVVGQEKSGGYWGDSAFAFLWRPSGDPGGAAPVVSGADQGPALPAPVASEARPASALPTPELDHAKVYGEIGWSVFVDDWVAPKFIAGFKCGDLGANHTQLDNNSFQLWAGGEWLAEDLGGGVYNKDYFSEKRWGMYVVSTAGHNGLLIGGKGQLPDTKGTLVTESNDGGVVVVVGDSSRCYGDGVKTARRHFAVVENRYVVILDEVETTVPQAVEWRLHTAGEVATDGSRATVTGKRGKLHVIFPDGAMTVTAGPGTGELPPRKVDNVISAVSKSKAVSHLLPTVLYPGAEPPAVSFKVRGKACEVRVKDRGKTLRLSWVKGPEGWRIER